MGTLTWGFGKPFGYEGKPGTCQWCGDRLRREKAIDPKSAEPYPGNVVLLEQGGYQGNGLFCTLRCGYQWAIRALSRR